jgi:hypothetical protein
MKNYILSILTLIGMLIVSSCSNDTAGVVSGELVPVTIVVGLDDNIEGDEDGRAISDGTGVDQLVYAVYNAGGEAIVSKTVKSNVSSLGKDSGTDLTVFLPSGKNYKIVCWAQNSKTNAYTVSDDMKVTVDYAGTNNDETRDAFYGVSEPFDVEDGTVRVALKRPFAQVNVAALPFDWEYVRDVYDFKATKSCAIIRNIANELDLRSGAVSGDVNAYFTPAAIPTEKLYADVDGNGVKEEYVYLSMSYVLAGEEESEHTVDFYFLDNKNQSVKISKPADYTFALKRNNQFDYVGQVLSDSGDLNIRNFNFVETAQEMVAEETTYENEVYVLNSIYGDTYFRSEDGQKITMNNVLFTGEIRVIELGKYKNSWYVNYNNELNNVVLENLNISCGIECHEWYFSPAVIAYGKTTLNDCVMTGTTTTRTTIEDKHGVVHQFIPADLGIRNESDAIINGGVYGTIFAWTHAVVDMNNVTVGKLYCGTCDSTKHSWMTIGSGTKIDSVICCEPRCPYGTKEYSTTMTIKSGAVVGSLQLVSTDVEFLIIEEGAQVGKITCEGVEYTYKELREAMGLGLPN